MRQIRTRQLGTQQPTYVVVWMAAGCIGMPLLFAVYWYIGEDVLGRILPSSVTELPYLLVIGPLDALRHCTTPPLWPSDAFPITIFMGLMWLVILGGMIGALVGAVLRSGRHRRAPACCAVCGYDLRRLTEPRCPECSAPFDPKLMHLPPSAGGGGPVR